MTGNQFDDSPYTQLTIPARGDIKGVVKDISEALPENQTKYITFEDDHQFGSWASKVRYVTASATVTLADTDPQFVEINPNGADRDVSLPAKADDNHGYWLTHVGSANLLTIKRSGGTVIGYARPGQTVYIRPSTLQDFFVVAGALETQYKITPTVATNDLTVTIKHVDGTTPSTTRPLWFLINNTWRAVTAALSITIVDGTNWFNAGSADLGTLLVPYFAYVVWDSNSSAVALTIARKCHYRVVASSMSTTTSENHIYGYSGFTAGDDMENIGFFEATLSLSATSHLWTVPTFTNANLKNTPTYETEEYTYNPQWASTGTQPAIGNGTIVGKYSMKGNQIFDNGRQTNGSTTTYGTGTYTWSLPFASKTISNYGSNGSCQVFDSSAGTFYVGRSSIGSNSSTINLATHAAASLMSGTVPIALATSDVIDFANVYYTS